MLQIVLSIILMPVAILAVIFTGAMGYGIAKGIFTWAANWEPFKQKEDK